MRAQLIEPVYYYMNGVN